MYPLDPCSQDPGVRRVPPARSPWTWALRLLPRSMHPALPPGCGPHCSLPRAHTALLLTVGPFASRCPSVGRLGPCLALPSLASRWGGFPGLEEEKLGPAGPPSLAPASAGCLGRLCPHTPGSAPLRPPAGCAPRAAPPPGPAPLAPRPSWVRRPALIPAGPAHALRSRRRQRRTHSDKPCREGAPGCPRRRALSPARLLPPHRDALLLHEAVSSVLFSAARLRVSEGRGRLWSPQSR